MAVARSAAYVALLLVLAVATVTCSEEQAAAVAEPVHPDSFSEVVPEAGMQEFLADQDFWSAVDGVSNSMDDKHGPVKVAQQHGHPIIEVAESDVATATAVARTAEEQEAQAEQMCLKAKRDVRSRAAGRSKAKRRAAVARLKKFCKHVRSVVTTEVQQDVKKIGKHTASQMIEATMKHTRTSSQAEKALFKKTLGNIKITGKNADKSAKQEATANALNNMAKKAMLKDSAKADKACQKAKDLAKKAGGKSTHMGRKKLKYADKFCAKMKTVIQHEKDLIKKDVQATAAGKEGPEGIEGHMAASNAAQDLADSKAQADQACDSAMKQAQGVAKAGRAKALAMAKTLCAKVKAVVQKEAAAAESTTGKVTPYSAVKGAMGESAAANAGVPEAAAAVQAKADAMCESAKTMAAKAAEGGDAKHKALAAAMAKSLCDKEKRIVKVAIQRMGKDTGSAPEAEATPEDAPENSGGSEVVDAIKAKADQACEHAKLMAAKIAQSGDLLKAAASTAMAEELCAKVQGVVKKEEAKAAKEGLAPKAEPEDATKSPDVVPVPMDHIVPEAAPEDAAEDSASHSTAKAMAKLKEKAGAACDRARHDAAKMAAAHPSKGALAKAMAEKMCAHIKGVVEKEQAKEQAIQGLSHDLAPDTAKKSATPVAVIPESVAKAVVGALTGKSKQAEDKDSVVKTAESMGRPPQPEMPAEVEKQLQADITQVHQNEAHNAAKATRLCEAAKRQIRGASGEDSSATARKRSIEIAVNFCQRTKSDIKKQKAADDTALAKLIKMEAAKYGMKVVKLGGKPTKAEPVEASETDVKEERKLFEDKIGEKDGEHVADKTGLKDARNQALEKALGKKLDQAKLAIKAKIKQQSGMMRGACEQAKMACMAAKAVGKRMSSLQKAIKFCKKAKKLLDIEKKSDYAQLEKIKKKVIAENKVDENGKLVSESKFSHSKSQASAGAEEDMVAKAAAMCTAMKDKAKSMSVPNDEARQAAVQQAKAFCTKAKTVVAKQAEMDEAAGDMSHEEDLAMHEDTIRTALVELDAAQNISEPF